MPAKKPLCPNIAFADASEQTHISKLINVLHFSAQLLNINLLESKDLIADEFLHPKGKIDPLENYRELKQTYIL